MVPVRGLTRVASANSLAANGEQPIAQSFERFALGCSPSTMKQIGIFTATRWELNAVRRAILVEEQTRIGGARGVVGRRGNGRLFVFQTGVGTAKADAVCRKVFASHPLDLAVSCGFACALTAADIGELLIGTDVIMYQATANPPAAGRVIPCAEHLTAAAVRAAPAAGLPARAGRFVTVPRVVWRAQDKREIAAGTGAVGLDMESAAVGPRRSSGTSPSRSFARSPTCSMKISRLTSTCG